MALPQLALPQVVRSRSAEDAGSRQFRSGTPVHPSRQPLQRRDLPRRPTVAPRSGACRADGCPSCASPRATVTTARTPPVCAPSRHWSTVECRSPAPSSPRRSPARRRETTARARLRGRGPRRSTGSHHARDRQRGARSHSARARHSPPPGGAHHPVTRRATSAGPDTCAIASIAQATTWAGPRPNAMTALRGSLTSEPHRGMRREQAWSAAWRCGAMLRRVARHRSTRPRARRALGAHRARPTLVRRIARSTRRPHARITTARAPRSRRAHRGVNLRAHASRIDVQAPTCGMGPHRKPSTRRCGPTAEGVRAHGERAATLRADRCTVRRRAPPGPRVRVTHRDARTRRATARVRPTAGGVPCASSAPPHSSCPAPP